jgi:hypothetical protein
MGVFSTWPHYAMFIILVERRYPDITCRKRCETIKRFGGRRSMRAWSGKDGHCASELLLNVGGIAR